MNNLTAILAVLVLSTSPVSASENDAPYQESRVIKNALSSKDESLLYKLSSARLYLLEGKRDDAADALRNVLAQAGDLIGHSVYDSTSFALLDFQYGGDHERFYFPDTRAVDFFYTQGIWESPRLENARWQLMNVSLDIDYADIQVKAAQALSEARQHRLEVADTFLAEIFDHALKHEVNEGDPIVMVHQNLALSEALMKRQKIKEARDVLNKTEKVLGTHIAKEQHVSNAANLQRLKNLRNEVHTIRTVHLQSPKADAAQALAKIQELKQKTR